MNELPVIFIHQGNCDYAPISFNQAKKYNKDVIFIGDNSNINSIQGKTFLISNYLKYAKKYEKIYEPLSTLGDYELFCFLRWFILYHFVKENNIEAGLYIDTDILLFVNATEEYEKKFRQFDLTLIHKSAPCTVYFTQEGLREFLEYLFSTYSKKQSYEYAKIASHYHVRQKFNLTGGVCDMTLFEYYGRYIKCNAVGELMYVIDDSVYDHCINQKDNFFEMKPEGIKNIKMINSIPYCFHEKLKKDIKFNSLHFQGGSKYFIPSFMV